MVYAKGGVGEATVWGSDGKKVPAREAAFANGAISDIMDWEDCHWTGHASAGAVPVALAMGEKLKLSGKDYMTAVVAGFEGYTRIAMAVQPSKEFLKVGSRWGLVSWQIFAASLAAAKEHSTMRLRAAHSSTAKRPLTSVAVVTQAVAPNAAARQRESSLAPPM